MSITSAPFPAAADYAAGDETMQRSGSPERKSLKRYDRWARISIGLPGKTK